MDPCLRRGDGIVVPHHYCHSRRCFVESANRAARIRDRLCATLVDMETAERALELMCAG
jgi:hypothetical protein